MRWKPSSRGPQPEPARRRVARKAALPAVIIGLSLACAGPRRGAAADGTSQRHAEGGPGGGPQVVARPLEGAAALVGSRLARVAFPDGRTFLAEVARTPEERARGLMFRKRLEPGTGMVFLLGVPDIHPFWMKNTLIPLDIIWLDAEGDVVHLERSVQPCKADPCPSVIPLRPSTWVLEVAAGQAGGLRLGDRLIAGREASPNRERSAHP